MKDYYNEVCRKRISQGLNENESSAKRSKVDDVITMNFMLKRFVS